MREGLGRKYHIDLMFLIVLFLVFTCSAVSVLLVAINSYKSVVNTSQEQASARVMSSYIKEAVRQNDQGGNVYVGLLDGNTALVIDQGQGYYRYIYQYDGYLMDLNAAEDSGATADFGDKITPVTDMSINQEGKIITVDMTDDYGNSEEVVIALKSQANEKVDSQLATESGPVVASEINAEEVITDDQE